MRMCYPCDGYICYYFLAHGCQAVCNIAWGITATIPFVPFKLSVFYCQRSAWERERERAHKHNEGRHIRRLAHCSFAARSTNTYRTRFSISLLWICLSISAKHSPIETVCFQSLIVTVYELSVCVRERESGSRRHRRTKFCFVLIAAYPSSKSFVCLCISV